jgi:hypothetical protein
LDSKWFLCFRLSYKNVVYNQSLKKDTRTEAVEMRSLRGTAGYKLIKKQSITENLGIFSLNTKIMECHKS